MFNLENKFWYLGLLSVVLFIGLCVVIRLLRDKPKLNYRIAWVLALFILVQKIIEYSTYQIVGQHDNYPVDLCAIAYFTLGLCVVFRIYKLESIAYYISLLAFAVYLGTIIIDPDSIVLGDDIAIIKILAFINHFMLFFISTSMLVNVRKLYEKDCWVQPVGFSLIMIYCWVIHIFTDHSKAFDKPLVCTVSDASLIHWLFPSKALSTTGTILCLIVLYSIVLLTMLIVHVVNNISSYTRRQRGGQREYKYTIRELWNIPHKKTAFEKLCVEFRN